MNKNGQFGFSLISMMVAMVIGLILTAAAIQVFVVNQQTYRINEALARIQENARFAMNLLARHIRMAGYRNDPSLDFSTAFPASQENSFATGEVIRGKDDEVVIRYRSDGSWPDCIGNPAPTAGTLVSEKFFLNGTNLTCQSGTETQALLSDVAAMAVLYGIDIDDDGAVDCFDSATHFNAASPTACGSSIASPWKKILSVRLTLTFQSAEDNTNSTKTGRMKKSYTTTIALRNKLL